MYYNKNYQNFPKKPVKTFQDLDVYRLSLEANVFVVNTIAASFDRSAAEVARPSGKQGAKSQKKQDATSEMGQNSTKGNVGTGTIKKIIIDTLVNCACSIPHLIAESHSFRFGSQRECLILLERVMLNCNKMAVYLDQTRDICNTGVEVAKFEELQKKYFFLRRKVLNLQRSWQKYMNMPKEEKMMRDFNH